MLFGRRKNTAWVRNTTLFDGDGYECPFCGASFAAPSNFCGACGHRVSGVVQGQTWEEEAELLEELLEEDDE